MLMNTNPELIISVLLLTLWVSAVSAVSCHWGIKQIWIQKKNRNFQSTSRYILKMVQNRCMAWLLWNVNRKSQVPDRSVLVPVTLSDLWSWRSSFSGASPYVCSYYLTSAIKFGMVTHVERDVFVRGQRRPIPRGLGPSTPEPGVPYLCRM